MTAKRTPLHRAQHARIGPEAIRLWRLICEIIEAGADEEWEENGGRRAEEQEAEVQLMTMLGLKPWHYSPAWVQSEGPPEPWEDPARHELAQQVRRALEVAAIEDAGPQRRG